MMHLIIHLIIGFNNLMKTYEICPREPYFVLLSDTALPANKPLQFRNDLIE